MSRPAWMPSGPEIVKQLLLAAIVGGVAWWLHQRLRRT
jgi:hypothetical protein